MIEDFEPYQGSFKAGHGEGKPPKNPLSYQPGCYVITHIETGKRYVGSSINLAGRVTGNLSHLKNGKHKNKNLQEAYNQNPQVEVVVKPTATEEEAKKLEQSTVDALLSTGTLCNIAIQDVTKTKLGLSLSDDHKEKLLAASLGKKRSDESRQRMSDSHKGKTLSEEHKAKLSDAHLQRLSTPEGKAAHAKSIEKLQHEVVVGGIKYPSKSEAARSLGLHVTTIMHRCKSSTFPDCYEIKEKKDE